MRNNLEKAVTTNTYFGNFRRMDHALHYLNKQRHRHGEPQRVEMVRSKDGIVNVVLFFEQTTHELLAVQHIPGEGLGSLCNREEPYVEHPAGSVDDCVWCLDTQEHLNKK